MLDLQYVSTYKNTLIARLSIADITQKNPNHMSDKNLDSMRTIIQKCYLCIMLIFITPRSSFAEIQFEDATQHANLDFTYATAGASWGDFNGDGWPDLWVGNHHFDFHPPKLFINKQDGTFTDISDSVWSTKPWADFHGAAWADFDHDGDQDLVAVSGGGAGRGNSPNYLFINENGMLRNEAVSLEIDYPYGRGRTPLWFDADKNGKLDLLVMNFPRPGGIFPSPIFQQTANGFTFSNDKFNFQLNKPSKMDGYLDTLNNYINFQHKSGSIESLFIFAQLADLTNDKNVDLITFSNPMKVFSIDEVPFKDVTNKISFPDVKQVQDAAIEDFTGNLVADIFLTRSNSGKGEIIQADDRQIKGYLEGSNKKPAGLKFDTDGKLEINIYPPWKDPTDPVQPPAIYVGSKLRVLSDVTDRVTFTADSNDVDTDTIIGPVNKRRISLQRDPNNNTWTMLSSLAGANFTISSTKSVSNIEAIGFEPSLGKKTDHLLVKKNNEFEIMQQSEEINIPTACFSVTAGDFDNDMDMDLYLVCSGAVENLPNRLYQNDGLGNFTLVADAGGAGGSMLGRGDVVATADYDRDGFLDLFVTNGNENPPFSKGPYQLFRNQGNQNHWIEIDLQGVTSNHEGIGTIIELETTDKTQIRTQSGGMHRFVQNHSRIHFGLGANNVVDNLTIRWPSGIVQQLDKIDADQVIQIIESAEKN